MTYLGKTTLINTTTQSTNTKDKLKAILASSFWGLLFLGGMIFGSFAVVLFGVLCNVDFVVDGTYALMDFMNAIGTDSFADAVVNLADKAAVLIHTTMCVGYLSVIVAMFIRRKEAGGFGTLRASETPDVFKWLTISMAASFGLDFLMQLACKIPYFAQEAATLSSVGVLSTAGIPWLALLTTGILAPIVEEIAFRRGIQKTVTGKFGSVAGIAVASITFGLMHGNAFQSIFAALMGVVLGVVYDKTGNLWYTTIIHIVNNSACVLISLFGLNGNLVSAMIPVVCGLLYVVTKKIRNEHTSVDVVTKVESDEDLVVD